MTPEEIVKKYIKGSKRHAAYLEAVDIHEHLSFHIDGFKPEWLIHISEAQRALSNMMGIKTEENYYFDRLIAERRPGETDKVLNHRKKIYASITKEPTGKVINSLNKIVRSDDWKIDYSKSDTIAQEGENLEDYCEKNYPGFGSITNWVYTFAIKKMLADPNGFIVVLPLEFPGVDGQGKKIVESNEFLRPFANYVQSEDVLFYEPKKTIAYRTNEVRDIILEDGQKKTVPVFRIITTEGVWEAVENSAREFTLLELMSFEMELPVVQNGGIVDRFINNIIIYNSFLNPMLPRLDESAREYSDMQAEVLLHTHSTMVIVQGTDCQPCRGTGKVIKKGGKTAICGDCKGRGASALDPYEQIVVRLPGIDKQQLPFPPAQYLEKSTEIVKIQNERIDAHLFKSLSSINMEFLSQTPLNQSGKAKEIDKEELNNFVYSVAFHLVKNIMNPVYKIISDFRYQVIIQDQKKRNELLPLIQVPEHFDLLTENSLIEQIGAAQMAKVDATIIQEMQVDYVNKKFRDSPQTRDQLIVSLSMNPFPTSSAEEIIEMEMNRDITKEDAVQYFYANYFVQKSVETDDTFLSKTFDEQLSIIQEMTDEKIKELKPEEPVEVPRPETPMPPEGE